MIASTPKPPVFYHIKLTNAKRPKYQSLRTPHIMPKFDAPPTPHQSTSEIMKINIKIKIHPL